MSQRSTKAQPRGFVLAIVAVIAVAAAGAALLLIDVTRNLRMGTMHTSGGETARSIAEAGLHRTRAYLRSFPQDIDRALDPLFDCDCSALAGGGNLSGACSRINRPLFNDSGSSRDFSYNGQKWTMVPYDGGAYLVRIEDNQDDVLPGINSDWDLNSNNNTGSAMGCAEGPALGGADNPIRDRDMTVWITVVGIHPGTDPARAKHRAVVRQLWSRLRAPPGMEIKGNLKMTGTGEFRACSGLTGIRVDGTMQKSGSGTGCTCGDSETDSNSGFTAPCTTCEGSCLTPASISSTPVTVPAVADFTAAADRYFDWSRPCLFYVDSTNENVWYWDAAATRGPRTGTNTNARCDSAEGANVAYANMVPPDPTRAGTASMDAWKGCWTPLIVRMQAECYASHGGNCGGMSTDCQERNADLGCHWQPNSDQFLNIAVDDATFIAGPDVGTGPGSGCASGTFPCGSMMTAARLATGSPITYDLTNLGLTWNKYNWATACTVVDPSDNSLPSRGCGGHCDGTHSAFSYFSAEGPFFNGKTADNIRALPAGVFIFSDSITFSGSGYDFVGSPPTSASLSRSMNPPYPLATIVTAGSFTSNTSMWFGFGQRSGTPNTDRMPYYPAVIANNSITLFGSGNFSIAGSIYSLADWNYNGGNEFRFFGEVHLNGDLNVGGSGKFIWQYDRPLNRHVQAPVPPLVNPI